MFPSRYLMLLILSAFPVVVLVVNVAVVATATEVKILKKIILHFSQKFARGRIQTVVDSAAAVVDVAAELQKSLTALRIKPVTF